MKLISLLERYNDTKLIKFPIEVGMDVISLSLRYNLNDPMRYTNKYRVHIPCQIYTKAFLDMSYCDILVHLDDLDNQAHHHKPML